MMTITSEDITQLGAALGAVVVIATFGRQIIAPIAQKEAAAAIAAAKAAADKEEARKEATRRSEIDAIKAQIEELERRTHAQEVAMAELRAIAAPVAAALRDLQRHLLERP